jgi:hypothetical protein
LWANDVGSTALTVTAVGDATRGAAVGSPDGVYDLETGEKIDVEIEPQSSAMPRFRESP